MDAQDSHISANELSELVKRISDDTISGKIAKDVFKVMWEGNGRVDDIIESQGLRQMSDVRAIEDIIDGIIADNSQQVEQFKAGNGKLLGYFVGQVMKATQGKANPKKVNQILNDKLS
jgi:aspartyl-tRNA(Asn)/glutamyl-tRNA(Gln) amidotransferase subunit B